MNIWQRWCVVWLFLTLVFPVHPALATDGAKFYAGVDLSSVPEYEKQAGYKMDGERVDIFDILQKQGINSVRLRVWNNPKDGICGIDEVAALAQRAHDHGMAILLDFHYSDTWADPQHQTKPGAWKDLAFPELCRAVQEFTRDTVARLVAQGTPPAMVQIGNEIRNGMLWPDGDVRKHDPEAMHRLAELVQAGVAGVRGVSGVGQPIGIVVHSDAGGYFALNRPLLDALKKYGVDYDVVGLSFYPGLSGRLSDLRQSMAQIVKHYDKQVIVAEVSYPWKPPLPYKMQSDFPATAGGQAGLLRAVVAEVQRVPGGKGIGVYYWGGEIIKGPRANQALFDADGNALTDSMRALIPY